MQKLLVQRERALLAISSLILINAVLAVVLAKPSIDFKAITVIIGVIAASFLVHLILRKGQHNGDPFILPVAASLAGLGLVIVLRLKPQLFMLQAAWMAIGLMCFVFTSFFARKTERLVEYKYICGVVGAALLISTIIFGVDIGGNKNWIILGPIRFQPSEFAKILIVVFLASYFSERREVLTYATKRIGPIEVPHARFIGPLAAVWGLTMLMLVFQRDLGSALLYFGTFIIMAYLASGRASYFLYGMTIFLIGAFILYKLFPHVQVRIDIWLHPWADPNGRAYQIVQSLFAMGTGGILGTGLTYGHPDIIPEVHTDFIFAAIGEEMGLAGTGAVMLLYMLLIYRGFRAAILANSTFSALMAGGLSVFMALQIYLIIGGVTKFLPLTGITLPFISYGGSSIVSNFIVLGILLAISEARVHDD